MHMRGKTICEFSATGKLGRLAVVLTMPDEATEKTMAVDDRAARTVWVGGLPASMSTGSDVEKILRRVGDIESAHVRYRSSDMRALIL